MKEEEKPDFMIICAEENYLDKNLGSFFNCEDCGTKIFGPILSGPKHQIFFASLESHKNHSQEFLKKHFYQLKAIILPLILA